MRGSCGRFAADREQSGCGERGEVLANPTLSQEVQFRVWQQLQERLDAAPDRIAIITKPCSFSYQPHGRDAETTERRLDLVEVHEEHRDSR